MVAARCGAKATQDAHRQERRFDGEETACCGEGRHRSPTCSAAVGKESVDRGIKSS